MTAAVALRDAIRRACRRDEAACLADLVAEYDAAIAPALAGTAVCETARSLAATVRHDRRRASGIDPLMHEFSLSTREGAALMCLAEALLRIPDAATADRLIRDKIGQGDWAAHLGNSPSPFVNAASWGLLLGSRLVAHADDTGPGSALGHLLARGGEPLVRRGMDAAMRQIGQQFVMGESIAAALEHARAAEARGYAHSYDMLGEAALTTTDATRYHAAYASAIHAIGHAAAGQGVIAGPGISIKLSALHPRYARAQKGRVMAELLPRLRNLMRLAREVDIGVNIDAEEADRLDLSLDLLAALATDPALAGWQGLGFVVQAYQKRAPAVIDYLLALARSSGHRLMVRLVKGAYWDSEIKRAQVDGLADYPVYTRKSHTDLAYLVCAARLLAAPDAVYPQFATHNAHSVAALAALARARGVDDYEFQCLHGMGEALYDQVVGPGRRCRIYAPVGSQRTLLPYLVRRLLENGANSSFVNRLVDDAVPLEALVADPRTTVAQEGEGPHPAIPRPGELFGPERPNSAGLDLADESTLSALDDALVRLRTVSWQAAPLVAGEGPLVGTGTKPPAGGGTPVRTLVRNPAERHEVVGQVIEADATTIERALARAAAASARWAATPPATRAACLWRAADRLAGARDTFLSLGIREAGKTRANALAEVREAVDFCRYYAARLSSLPAPGAPPGPVVCISPWNFPLAIFIGQISAALAAGSPVIAKPAEQTPLTAQLAVTLLHAAGVPADVLQCLPGPGETVGARLVADPRVSGVLFTGSTAVARCIHQQLARRAGGSPAPQLIAETGGQNAMIVDSSALAEQVVQDALTSGFDSAGQRCSALRVLCLQEDIADATLALLRQAMDELQMGDPADLATDIGPVIDPAARQHLLDHIDAMRRRGYPIHQAPLPAVCAAGTFVPPTLVEIDTLAALPDEVFGPVIHVLRFAHDALPALVDALNATGYGLTLGLHSRIDQTIADVVARARVGNLYVNRNQIGAVVGVQPFGGEGLSGTGPKAGGPLILPRLAGCGPVTPARLGVPPAPSDSALLALQAWAEAGGRPALAARCRACAEMNLAGIELALPGPTGERNTLRFRPRGAVLCQAATAEGLLEQLAAVLATGNTARLPAQAAGHDVLSCLPGAVLSRIQLRSTGNSGPIFAALLAEDDLALRLRLADLDGPLCPALLPDPASGHYPLDRLIVERVLTRNTAAAGGNVALMTLGGQASAPQDANRR